MSLWNITHPLPLPHQIESREEHQKAFWKESECVEKAAARSDACFKCGGEKTVEKVDYELLEQEVRDGQIMKSHKDAILTELIRLLPPFAFESNE